MFLYCSYHSGEAIEDVVNGNKESLPVLNIPFKANNRFEKSLESYMPIAPRPNQIYSYVPPSSTESSPSSSQEGEVVLPSGDSVYVTSPLSGPSHVKSEYNRNVENSSPPVRDKPNPETSAKLKEVLKRSKRGCKISEPPDKKIKLEKYESVDHEQVDKSVTKLSKQVLILKKQKLKRDLEKLDMEKEKIKLETEKIRIETETAKLNKEKALAELLVVKQKFSAFL